jgi:H+/Cl- antiporter ClcA
MAAAYNVPFGGALFAVEVLLGTLSSSTVLPALVVSVIATVVSWSMLPNTPTYRTPTLPPTHSLIVWAFLAGPLMGVAAIGFVRLIHWSRKHAAGSWPAVLLPIPALAALGAAAIWWPELLGNGRGVIQMVFDSRLAVPLLCWLLILRPLATALCFRTGVPGGVFTPTMTFGALTGAVLGQLWSYVAPATDKRSYAILGAGAVLSAATQAPLSSIAFILELTYNGQTLIVPLLIAVAGATITFRRLEPNAMS